MTRLCDVSCQVRCQLAMLEEFLMTQCLVSLVKKCFPSCTHFGGSGPKQVCSDILFLLAGQRMDGCHGLEICDRPLQYQNLYMGLTRLSLKAWGPHDSIVTWI